MAWRAIHMVRPSADGYGGATAYTACGRLSAPLRTTDDPKLYTCLRCQACRGYRESKVDEREET